MPVRASAQGGKAAQGSCLARPIVGILLPLLHYTAGLSYLSTRCFLSLFGKVSLVLKDACVFAITCPLHFSACSGTSSLENQTIGIVKRTFKYLDKIIFVELSTFVLPILLSSRYDVVLTYKQNLLKNMQKK